ncbi:alpha/beta hydrolase [Candidatus Bipolaricaulota bacterium]|nr:alpha/beta hydrolase [Candidatus Bipolaricaulota bacterium]MBS3813949.1 alpha/beta hydrolase [Candidatus Bipolaricaulota bacterium]MBS3825876.1 alpha/beta hydrolase [Candidatus Bipolaricaulota bacterium]
MFKIGKSKFGLPFVTIIVGLLLAGIATTTWFLRPQDVMVRASKALEGNQSVDVCEKKINGVKGFLFSPNNPEINTGLIFYPGARVPARAYAPHILKIAEKGYEVFIVSMPLNLAILGPRKADKIIEGRERVRHWVIAGHSMGGAMAAQFAEGTDRKLEGLIFWASYPPETVEFDRGFPVLSITASRDKIINRKKVTKSRTQLPSNTKFVEIEGGNHSQFGWYGFQSGDGEATISRSKQMEMIVRETVTFLSSLDG